MGGLADGSGFTFDAEEMNESQSWLPYRGKHMKSSKVLMRR